MKSLISHFKRLDWILLISVFSLVAMGILSIYSSSFGDGDFLNFKKQIIFSGIGIILMIVLSFFDWRFLKNDPYFILILYFLCLFGLLGLFFFAPEIRNVKSWYKIGEISIDPAEFTKIVLIILLAKYFSTRHIEMYQIRHILFSGFYIFLPSLLIFLQPGLGTVLIILCLWIGILIISGIKIRHFLMMIFAFLLIFAISWSTFLRDYQKERIVNFFAPQVTQNLEIGWSQSQSKVAIGSGGMFGQGIKRGSQTQYGFLPEPQTDFIFAAIAEETGLAGVGILLALFFVLIWRTIKIAVSAENNFPRLFSSGFAILLISQIFINIGMNLGILPIIGIPLPFISYGGSSLMAFFIGLGILQSIKTKV